MDREPHNEGRIRQVINFKGFEYENPDGGPSIGLTDIDAALDLIERCGVYIEFEVKMVGKAHSLGQRRRAKNLGVRVALGKAEYWHVECEHDVLDYGKHIILMDCKLQRIRRYLPADPLDEVQMPSVYVVQFPHGATVRWLHEFVGGMMAREAPEAA